VCTTNRVTRSCEACQKFSARTGAPSQLTKLIAHTCPLQRWELDIVGPLPTAQGNLKFTFVVVEYFTKWIEARAISTITSKTAQKNLLAEHRVLVRSPIRANSRQWKTVRKPRFPGILQLYRHEGHIHFCLPPTIQQSS
jgi:hypothetical protein